MAVMRPSRLSCSIARTLVASGVRGSGRVKLVQIEALDAERHEAALAGFSQMLGAAVRCPPSARPRQPAFRSDAHARPVAGPGRERASDEALVVTALGVVPTINVRSVEKLDPRIERSVQDCSRARLIPIGLRREPHAAEAGNTHADDCL
jgi:hypothetical protein